MIRGWIERKIDVKITCYAEAVLLLIDNLVSDKIRTSSILNESFTEKKEDEM